jgi:glycerol kinase
MPRYTAAIDQGTTSTRFIIFDQHGASIACAQKEHRQIYPRAGWVEHDPEEIWRATQEVMQQAAAEGRISANDIAAIGITNQRETTILWDRKTGAPVCNAIVWQDTRVSDYIRELAGSAGQDSAGQDSAGIDRFRAATGLPLSTYFSSLKIRWALDNISGLRQRAEAGDVLFGTVDSFLLWRLSGGRYHITDVTNASRTQLMNLATLDWDDDLLRAFDIPRAMLPQVHSSSEVYFEIAEGPFAGVPMAAILGDQQAALFGQTCFNPGEAKNTYGTGCFLLMNTGTAATHSTHGLLTTVACKLGDKPATYALEGSIAITGALVQWLRDNLQIIRSSSEVEALATSVEDNGGVYFVPAFSGLYAPYWKDSARGVIAGLTRFANKGHIARAALEGTAFQTREVLEAMEKDSGRKLGVLRVDGGMVENDLLMQFQADILNRQVVKPANKETTALGAAYAAGLAVGFFKGTQELSARWAVEKTWEPQLSADQRERAYRMWKKAVTRSFDWVE